MSDKLKSKLIPMPPPKPVYVKLRVLKDLTIGNVVYMKDHEIEVFYHEARKLLETYEDCFEVLES